MRALGEHNVSTHPEDLDCYSTDALTPFRAYGASPTILKTADVMVTPESLQQVVDTVALATNHRTPIVPHGAGTGVMGGAIPVLGGIVLHLGKLNRVVDVNTTDRTVLAEAGVVLVDLENVLKPHGLMLGHDPWSVPIATVGGAISTNGVGYRAAAYGPMGDQVLALEVVMPDGRVLTTRSVPKYSSGPDLNRLFIGTEGAFGIITKAWLRVFRTPEIRSFAAVGFDGFNQGFKAIAELFALGLKPALIDLTEEPGPSGSMSVCLIMVYEGYKEMVSAQRRRSLKICRDFGGTVLGRNVASDHWKTRHQIADRYQKEMLGQTREVRWRRETRAFDYLHIALPVSQVLEYRRRCEDILSKRKIHVVEFAIWTQPELFSMLLVLEDTITEVVADNLGRAVDEVLVLAQDMGGTMEYCHGVGIKLAHLLPREMGEGYATAKAIKHTLDPHNIMNPGKIF